MNPDIVNHTPKKSTRLAARTSLVAGTAMAMLLTANTAFAGKLMEYLRDYDLNDYAFGLALSIGQSPYLGAENSTFAYPFLTSFRDSAFTDDWLLIREGDLGIRWVSEGGWELGLVGRIQTLGLGSSDTSELRGLDDREWTLELAPIVGWRGWPVHINFKTYTDILGRHDGLISQLALSLPYESSRGYIVPAVELIHRDEDYTNYYYGVSASEALPTRPEYQAGDALNTALKVRWGYAITDKWLLSGNIGLEYLDSAISNSPIVSEDKLWSAGISVAYNSNIFQPRAVDRAGPRQPRFEFRVGVFSDTIDSKVLREASDGSRGDDIDLENLLGLPDSQRVLQFDAIFRIGTYHRIEVGYMEMARNGLTTLVDDATFGDELFSASTTVASSFKSRMLRVGYAYSLMNDDQKELGVMAGLHYSRFETEMVAPVTGQRSASNTATPLPVIGVHGSVELGQKATLGARIQIFRMEFDQYQGSLNYATLDLQRRFGDNVSIGIGYNYYAFKLESAASDSRGSLEISHHGPVLFVSTFF